MNCRLGVDARFTIMSSVIAGRRTRPGRGIKDGSCTHMVMRRPWRRLGSRVRARGGSCACANRIHLTYCEDRRLLNIAPETLLVFLTVPQRNM